MMLGISHNEAWPRKRPRQNCILSGNVHKHTLRGEQNFKGGSYLSYDLAPGERIWMAPNQMLVSI